MPIALDYTSRIDPTALRAAGVTVVCRYLSWPHYWDGQTHTGINPKIIQRAEYDELVRAGLRVVLNWEFGSEDWKSGGSGARAQAAEAVRQAQDLGYPAGSVIVGSADFNMTRTDWTTACKAYAQAYVTGVLAGGYTPGVYGPYDVLSWCRDEVPGFGFYWQAGMSTAWDSGRNANPWPDAHLRQRGTKTVGGVAGDWNEILREFGMDLTTVVPNTATDASKDRTIGQVEGDSENLRNILWGEIQSGDARYAPDGSPLAQLLALPAAVEALAGQQQPTITLTAEQVQVVGQVVAAALPDAIRAALQSLTFKVE